MISAKNLSLLYDDGTYGLRDATVEIPGGRLVYITGVSGSGKTSFIKLLLGVEKPTGGSLEILGKNMTSVRKSELMELRQRIGPVFQDFKLLDGRSAGDNVMIGLRFLKMNHDLMYQITLSALEKVGLSHKIHSLVDNLSYGERQRVAIARAVARSPRLIIADEPTGNLDKNNSLVVLELLKSFVSKDTTVIVTTHATHLIQEESDYIHIMIEDGTMLCEEVQHGF